jgi:hypothetical protein
MRRVLLATALTVSLAGLPTLVGCDREVEHSKTVDVKSDGDVVKKEKKVTENADGSVTKTETKDVNKAP